MDIHVLKTFVTVCEYSGFSAAAEKLGYTQSTVSSQIKQLETELDTRLFDRIRHSVRITEDGMIVLKYAKDMLVLKQQMEQALHHKDEIQGKLRVAIASSIGSRFFSKDYLDFHKRYPGIKIKVIECGTEQMFELLRKNEVDIVFTLDTHIYDSEFIICGEAMEQVHFVAAADHSFAKMKRVELVNLLKQPFILTEQNMSYRKLFDQQLAFESLEIEPLFEIGSSEQICKLLADCKAISFLPDFMTQKYVDNGQLAILNVPDFNVNVWTQLLIHRNKWISPVMHAFIAFYKDIIANGEIPL